MKKKPKNYTLKDYGASITINCPYRFKSPYQIMSDFVKEFVPLLAERAVYDFLKEYDPEA